MSKQHASEFGCLLRRLRIRALLTQEALAEAANLSARTVSDLERGVSRTAHQATAELLAAGLGLAGLEHESFIAAARGRPMPAGAQTPGLRTGVSRAVTPVEALIGRDSELATLVKLIAEVAGGSGNAVLIEGEPGIGKSALVRTALAEAADTGCAVFWGAGDELGQALPLLPMLDALRVRDQPASPRRRTIVGLLRGEGGADYGMDVAAVLAEQLLALITEQCAAAPTILIIDDLQWADPASITLWGRLARLVRQLPLLLIGMMRPVPQREDLMALRRVAGDTQWLRLTGLDEAAVRDLVTAVVGAKPGEALLRLADGAAGNPLYVIELFAALARSSSVTVTSAGAVLVSSSAPGSLAAAIADRLGFVSGSVREVLRAAALLGVDFAVPDLAVVLDRSMADLLPALDEARAAGVLGESGSGLGFRHPLIHAALYEGMPAPVRAAWHREAGRALAEAGAQAGQVARQLLQAVGGLGSAEPVDEWMLSWLARSAQLLVAQAPQAAVDLLRRAAAGSLGTAHHDLLTARLADGLYRVGEAVEAEQVASRALARAVAPDLVVDLHWTLAQCRMRAGRFAESLATLDAALASPGISARHRARLLALAARTHCVISKPEKAGEAADIALEVASQAGDNWAAGWSLHVLTIVAGVRGQTADALPLFDRALAVTEADQSLIDLRLLLQINKAVALGDLDRFGEAVGVAREALQLADRAGMVIRQVQAHSVLGELFFDMGRWDEAMAEVEAMQMGVKAPMTACCDLGVAAVIRFHRGEIPAARRTLAAAVRNAGRIGSQVIGSFVQARSLDRERAGASADALAVLTAWFAEHNQGLAEVEDLLPDAVRLARDTGDLATARVLAGHAEALAAGSEIPHRQANALYCLGTLQHDAGRLVAAADRYAEAGRPLLSAKALEAAAGDFLRTGNRDQAWAAADRAVEIFTSLRAATDIARLQAGGSYL
jgi:tetratricopeptide (TPR) repeat protein/transcriptional regulator with XRE-family HTH domain